MKNRPNFPASRLRAMAILCVIMFVSFPCFAQYYFNGEVKWKAQTEAIDYTIVGDFNGDGMTDVAYHIPINHTWKVMTSNGYGFNNPVWWTNGQGTNSGVFTGDFNGDGMTDKLSWVNQTDPTWGGWWVAKSQEDQNLNYSFSNESKWRAQTEAIDYMIVGDFNGDGMTDAAYHILTNHTWKVMTSNGYGFNNPVTWATGQGVNTAVYVGDFNGDGLADKVSWVNSTDATYGGWWVARSQGTSFSYESKWKAQTEIIDYMITGDFNGDRFTDIAYHIPTNQTWKVMTSSGTGFNNPVAWTIGQGINSGVFSGDFNGEGFADKLSWVNLTDPTWGGWWVATSNNPNPRLVGMWYYGAYYVNAGVPPKEDSTVLWYKKIRDTLKIPIVGWGTDTISGEYSCQNADIAQRQLKAMKKAGIDFIMYNLTDGYCTYDQPSYPPFYKGNGTPYYGDCLSCNALDHLLAADNSLSPNQIPIAISLGFEFWGRYILCSYFQSWTSYNDQLTRQTLSVNNITSRYINNYPGLFFKYLGRILFMPNTDNPLNYPSRDENWIIRPRQNFRQFTVRYGINWAATFSKLFPRWEWDGDACAPSYPNNYVEGVDTKRFWSWGGGALDINGQPDTRPLPTSTEQMSIMPGSKKWTAPGDPVLINNRNGNYYMCSWKQVLVAKPRIVLIADYNNWNEEVVIEGCRGPNGWKDYQGNNQYDWYLQITQAYSTIFKTDHLPANIYVQEDDPGNTNPQNDNSNQPVFYWNGSYMTSYASTFKLTNGKPIIKLPASWLSSHGYSTSYPNPFNKSSIENSKAAQVYQLAISNFPSPFNPSTTFSYSIPKDGFVTLKVFDILGREVATLVNEVITAGVHKVAWSPTMSASGVYFYRLRYEDKTIAGKMLYLK
jgi:hypothetical protein